MNPMRENHTVHLDVVKDQKIPYKDRSKLKLEKRVEHANSWGDRFFDHYLTDPNAENFNKRQMKNRYAIHYKSKSDLGGMSNVVTQCLNLIEETSKSDYVASEIGWSRVKKRKEMLLPDMRYIIFEDWFFGGMEIDVAGFVSFMITYEDGHEVLYIYEIHFREKSRGFGWATMLMDIAEQIGWEVGVEKAMLTVFKANEKAISWYKKRGYDVDEYSPEPRKLRNGTVKESKYLILSKCLREEGEDVPPRGRGTVDREVKEMMAREEAGEDKSGIDYGKIKVRDPTAADFKVVKKAAEDTQGT
jgi:ribosomal protein S18 acetylase RimI-like enzyme